MLSLGIKRKWAFKENVATLNNCTESVCACAYDPFHLLRVAENFLPISSSFIVSLVEAAASDKDLEMAVLLRIQNLAGVRKLFRQISEIFGHRTGHGRFGERVRSSP